MKGEDQAKYRYDKEIEQRRNGWNYAVQSGAEHIITAAYLGIQGLITKKGGVAFENVEIMLAGPQERAEKRHRRDSNSRAWMGEEE